MKLLFGAALLGALLPLHATAQLIGPVGATTPLSEKTHICNVLDYGARNDNTTDVASAFEAAFTQCVIPNPGIARLYVPQGQYLLNRSLTLSNGTGWALQLEGLVTLAYGGNFSVERELILQGFAGVEALNATINGEGDGEFLEDGLVIVNGMFVTASLFFPLSFLLLFFSFSSPFPPPLSPLFFFFSSFFILFLFFPHFVLFPSFFSLFLFFFFFLSPFLFSLFLFILFFSSRFSFFSSSFFTFFL